ncbi:MAG TPA: 6,7-dimethyl-8-ribityllumazine synthase [Azoarcus sp.]|nr:6,7-dimethyl-8-ribityllumazine synthase [Azoarcus sp.]
MRRTDHHSETENSLDGKNLRVGIVTGRFNQNICDGLLSACLDRLAELGVAPEDRQVVSVPGALEIPLVLQTMAKSGRFDALIALGAIIRGETYHFEIVSNEMAAGVTRVGLDANIPIANGVLTTENEDQALSRMREKGEDCAACAVEMANLLKALR